MASQLPAPPPVDYGALNKLLAAAPNTAGLAKQAAGQAAADTNAVTASLRGQQAAEMQRAQQTAAALLGAAQAASGQLAGMDLGGHQADALRQAALDQAGLASGFSGQLRDTATDQSNTLLRALDALHAPGGAPNTGEQAGNVVYGVGKLPADAMLAAAPFAEAQARALPAQLLAHGQEEATGALGAGAQRAHELDPQIAEALAKQPALARQYLGDLQKAAADAREASIGNMFKALTLQQHGYEQESLRFYRQAQLDQHESDAAQRKWLAVKQLNQRTTIANQKNIPVYDAARSNSLGYAVDQFGNALLDKSGRPHLLPGYRINANGVVEKIPGSSGAGTAGKINTTMSARYGYQVDDYGHPILVNGKPVRYPKGAGAGGGGGGLTANQGLNKSIKAADQADLFYYGVPPKYVRNPNYVVGSTKKGEKAKWLVVPGTGIVGIDYGPALRQMMTKYGLSQAQAEKYLNDFYAPGQRGRPAVPEPQPPSGLQGPRTGPGGPVGIRG